MEALRKPDNVKRVRQCPIPFSPQNKDILALRLAAEGLRRSRNVSELASISDGRESLTISDAIQIVQEIIWEIEEGEMSRRDHYAEASPFPFNDVCTPNE